MDITQFCLALVVSDATKAYVNDAILQSQTAEGMSILSFMNDNLDNGYVPLMFYGNGSAADKQKHETMTGKVREVFCTETGKSAATISETYQAILNHESRDKFMTFEGLEGDKDSKGKYVNPVRIKLDFKAAVKMFKAGTLTFRINRTTNNPPTRNAESSRKQLMGGLDRAVVAITTNTEGAFKVGDKVTPLFGAKGKKGEKVLTPDGETQKALMLSKAIAVVNAIDPTMLSDKGLAVIQTVEAVAS